MKLFIIVSIVASCATFIWSYEYSQESHIVDRVIVHQEDDFFMGWPANNGVWKWKDGELLVGFTKGPFVEKEESHNVDAPYESWLARSRDGGHTWKAFNPKGFVSAFDPEGLKGDSTLTLKELTEPLDFQHENFAMRVIGNGYLQPQVPEGGFFYSYDRGKKWIGPFTLKGIFQTEELKGMEFTPRTDYIIESEKSALLFLSARSPGGFGSDKTFVARTSDGGQTFKFLSWIVDPEDPYRAVMPSTVETASGKLISAIRRREVNGSEYCWIDIYISEDNGKNWEFESRAGETGHSNGNPPALIQLSDGRLLVAYGNREHHQIRARFSSDEGDTWGPVLIIREGNVKDFGYPRLIQNENGNIVTIYYWAKSPESEKYIEATIWNPDKKNQWDKPIKLTSN